MKYNDVGGFWYRSYSHFVAPGTLEPGTYTASGNIVYPVGSLAWSCGLEFVGSQEITVVEHDPVDGHQCPE